MSVSHSWELAGGWCSPVHIGDMLLVHWLDSDMISHWHRDDGTELDKEASLECRSAGFLHFASEDRLWLVQSLATDAGDGGQLGNILVIPRIAITKIVKLVAESE